MVSLLVNPNDVRALLAGTISGAVVDSQVNLLAGYVSDLARTYCGQQFLQGTYKEQYRGNGGVALVLNQNPITAVSYLSINNFAITACPQDTNGAYLVNSCGFGFSGGEIFLYGGGRFNRSDRPNVFVNYVAGYSSIANLPQDFYVALVSEAVWIYSELKRLGKVTDRFTEAGTEQYKIVDISPKCKGVLDHYKSWNLNT